MGRPESSRSLIRIPWIPGLPPDYVVLALMETFTLYIVQP
jgi:hypothetical protein